MNKSISTVKSVKIVNENTICELANRFSQFVDVSALSIKSYNSDIRKFLTYLHENGITAPTRNTVIEYKKTLYEK